MSIINNGAGVDTLNISGIHAPEYPATLGNTKVNTSSGSPNNEGYKDSTGDKSINLSIVDNKLSNSSAYLLSKDHVGYVASAFSEVVLNYTESSLKNTNNSNIYCSPSISTLMETRSGAGFSAAAISNNNSSVSVVSGSESLIYFKQNLINHYSSFKGTVFHVSCDATTISSTSTDDINNIIEFSSLGAIVLTSSSLKESVDKAILAHFVAKYLRVPVFHLFYSSQNDTHSDLTDLVSYERLVSFGRSFEDSLKNSDYEPKNLVSELFKSFNTFFGSQYEILTVQKSASSENSIISFGNQSFTSLKSGPTGSSLFAKFLAIDIHVYGSWTSSDISSVLSTENSKKVVVLGNTPYSSSQTSRLYLEILTNYYFGNINSTTEFIFTNLVESNAVEAEKTILSSIGVISKQESETASVRSETVSIENEVDTNKVSTFAEPQALSSSETSLFELNKQVVFNESFNSSLDTSPEYGNIYTIKVSKTVRLTPESYDRNLFHIEFDIGSSGLTYAIGEALGVYGENDKDDTLNFLNWYGVNPDTLFTKYFSDKAITNTSYQWVKQKLDIFGRPGKKFYEFLAAHATDEDEAAQLKYIVSPEGKESFKQRVEDTVTYADLLLEFKSAHPPFSALIDNVPFIKQRHYSISSSANMHPNKVHLLIVTVGWDNKNGARYGLCTRYLNNLKIGDEIKVSVKPSAMKLPEDDMKPVIMAGLGTGMAPFKAFIEERAYRKAQGIEIGPMALYFGSRHRKMEYLYGEELEAYHTDGILSRIQLAFSRDQKEKVYIQNKLTMDSDIIKSWLLDSEGSFYLCGPTWPVADVKEAIVNSFVEYSDMNAASASKTIEEMKDHERYVLEVY
ncbi:putative sulfite reductase [NADPH] flavoprotein component [Smittium culicis]|uniref:assimilatory sulfite reductase (NADPH) n=1 Tax=Smittium culicis TaxID=133412 RepID=A0A1R1YAW2_9FUNG|nr:putative sulfite reductase [NADPH] flavoprotein component [Smittium culicis]